MSKQGVTIYRNMARDVRSRMTGVFRNCLRKVRKTGCTPVVPGNEFLAACELMQTHLEMELESVFNNYRNRRGSFEPLFSMPPARRPKSAKAGRPLTLVERRAAAAKRKVREWQRKSKLAATKIKAYRKKVSYYTKKGVIQ